MNEDYRAKYNIWKLPDKPFIDKIIKCFKEKDYDSKFLCAKNLYNHFLEKFNDFDINKLEIRSSVE